VPGIYRAEAVRVYEEAQCGFVIVACKILRRVETTAAVRLETVAETDADDNASLSIKPAGLERSLSVYRLRTPKTKANVE